LHVFITHGFEKSAETKSTITILEVGLGTGLNCLLTLQKSREMNVHVSYVALEPYPLTKDLTDKLNYGELLGGDHAEILMKIHKSEFSSPVKLSENFTFRKEKVSITDLNSEPVFDLVYFDAFGPVHEPHLWTVDVFKKVFDVMSDDSMLVTYCAKGEVKRSMKAVGFLVEKLPGPPGKREMTRGVKRNT
jgi:tRNA U34 5-methylaminomethyl-2-thiouridine-forming methyltransferase MnmC